MRTAIVTDTNSGLTEKQGGELGVFVLPMPVLIDGKEYFEGKNLDDETFYAAQTGGRSITTSQPSPESVMALWDRVLADYDELVYIPMSSGLSGSMQTSKLLAEESYEGRVFVADNHRISVTQRSSVIDAKAWADRGYNAKQICAFLEKTGFSDASIYIMVDTLTYLRKGGRITPAAAALGTLLRIKPVLTIQGEKLDAFARARTAKQGKTTMLTAIAHDLASRFGDPEGKHTHLMMAYTYNRDAIEEFRDEFSAAYPGEEIFYDRLPLSIATHIGPGALALAVTKKYDYDHPGDLI
jgi:DegV family protein with EDD domain